MGDTTSYRGNKIRIKRQDGEPRLLINGVTIATETDSGESVRSAYSYLPAADLVELGKMVVDQQLAMAVPTLEGLVDESA